MLVSIRDMCNFQPSPNLKEKNWVLLSACQTFPWPRENYVPKMICQLVVIPILKSICTDAFSSLQPTCSLSWSFMGGVGQELVTKTWMREIFFAGSHTEGRVGADALTT
jgi:hypothetical protein